MRAALLERLGRPLVVADVQQPSIGPDEVLVRTAGCGICRTDLHMQDGVAYRPNLPHILGHEPAGRVAALGAGVVGWTVGQPVAPYLFDSCGRCNACLAGSESQCDAITGILGVSRSGGFAEYFSVRADNLFAVPGSIELTTAGLVSCAAITAVHAVRRAQLVAGQQVALIGAGGIGLMILQILLARGHAVHVVDTSEAGRASSLAEGAASADPPEDVSDGIACERVFDLVGTARSGALAGRLVRRRGRIVVIGEEPEFPAIDTIALAQREIEIVGSRNGGKADALEALLLMADGIIRPRVTRRVRLDDINEAFSALRGGRVHGRIVVEFPA